MNFARRGCTNYFSQGRFYLSKHDPENALKSFEAALELCPIDRNQELARILSYLGITFMKLGMSNCALKSWGTAQKLNKQGYASKLLRRFSNDYGMAKQVTQEIDDWKAFYAVHLARYLSTKKSKRLGTDAEKDMIWDLILDGWREVKARVDLAAMSSEEKMHLFSTYDIVFPLFAVPVTDEGKVPIPVDFSRKRRVSFEDHCFCGSGLPFKICCGRTPGEDELANGLI